MLIFAMMTTLLPVSALAASAEPVFEDMAIPVEQPIPEEPVTEEKSEAAMSSVEGAAEAQTVDRDWVIEPLITEDNAVTRDPDPEAPAAWGAVPDDAQLYYHEQELAAFIHFGVNTFTGAEWGTGNENPAVFNPTAMTTQEEADTVAEQWVQAFKAGGFKRLILVGKHHDGFCIWPSQHTDRDTDSSSVPGVDVVWAVSKACTKHNMDMGFYLSPWDESAISYGYRDANGNTLTKEQEAQMIQNGELDEMLDYNVYYDAQLREILGNDKYGNNGKFVEVWMDGAKGTGAMAQDYDFSKWFRTIKELEPDARSFGKIAGSGIRWAGNEQGISGAETCWMKMDIDANGELVPGENNKAARYLGLANGAIWSVNECDVSIRNGWFHGAQRDMDTLINMYYNSVGHGSVFLLNTPPTTTGEFTQADVTALEEFGAAIRQTYATNFAAASAGATATTTQGTERTSATTGKFSASKVLDEDNDTYWTLQDGATSGQITIDLGQDRTFDLISIQEYIPLGQRIASTTIEYCDANGNWHTFAETTTIGARRLALGYPVTGSKIRITVSNVEGCGGVPLLSSVGVYKASPLMAKKGLFPQGFEYMDDRNSAFSYSGSWSEYNNGDGLENTHKGSGNAGNSVTGTFTGTKFYIIGIVDPNHGLVEVSIDGGAAVTFDTHASSRATKQILYTSPDLEPGQHTVVMKVKSGGSATYFDFDGIYYVNAPGGILEFSKETYSTREGEPATVKVVRTSGSEGDVTFKVIDLPGSAVSGQHYNVVDETITLHAGETEAFVTANTIRGDAAGKRFFLQITAVEGNALAGNLNTATINVLEHDAIIAQEPVNGETFTAQDTFTLPSAVDRSNRLEAEYMVLDSAGAQSGKEIRIQTDSNASGGKKLGWFEPNNKATLHYYAPVSGVYTMTFRYESGRAAGNLNKVNWRGSLVEDRSTDIPGTMTGGSLSYGTASFDIIVNEAGPGTLEFYADAQASPNIDYIDFALKTPSGGVSSVTLDRSEVTLYLNGAEGEDMTQLVATVLPEGADAGAPVWSTSNADVAYVRQDGTVGARSNGTAVITVAVGEGAARKEASATITVKTRVTGELVISGAPKYNAMLVASVNQISHQGAKAGLTYQWKRDDTPISGAVNGTYTVSAEDIGHTITVTATATGNYVGSKTSASVMGTKADGPEVVATLDYTDCTAAGNDGKITGLNTSRAYQYKATDAADWTDIPGTPGASQLTGLTPGSYHVRVKETATHAAGPASRTLTILAANAQGYNIYIGSLTNGRVTANVRRAASGAVVTLTAYPAQGYQMTVGSLKVTGLSGDVTVANDGTFTMPAEDVSVTAAFETRTYTITHQLTNIMCSMGQQDHVVTHDQRPVITLTPVDGYELPQTVTVRRASGNSSFSDYTYLNGTINFTRGIDADLEIIGEARPKSYTVTYEIPHLSATLAPRAVSHGDSLSFTIQPADGNYTLPETIEVSVNGTALAASAYTYSADGTVTVAAAKITGNVVIRAEGVRLTEEVESVSVSGTAKMGQQLTATVIPANATVVYQWVRMDDSGTRTNIPNATYARYMLTSEDVGKTILVEVTGTGGYGGTVRSTPTEAVADSPLQPVSGVTLDQAKAGIGVGKTLQLTATVTPENATNKTVRWMSSNEFVASVNEDGVVTGLAEGEAIITVITNNGGRTAQCMVTVGGVMLDHSTVSLTVNETTTLTATVLAEVADKRVTWSSSNTSVATVDDNGVVTGLAAGKAVITATTVVGGYTAACAVTVTSSGGSSGGNTGGSSGGNTGTKPVTPDETPKPVNPDGSVTNPDGSVTYPDGRTTIVGTDRRTGTETKITTWPDGQKAVQTTTKEETTIVVTSPEGETLAEIALPAALPRLETGFADVPQDHWAREAVETVAALDLMRGVGSNLYDMDSPVTRGSLATVLYRLSNGKVEHNDIFRDVKAGKYYTEGVTWAAKTGVVTGFTAEIFAPEQTITREQLAVMFARYAKLIGFNTAADTKVLDAFADGAATGDWAANGVAWCVENGILKGKGKNGLDPTAPVTRGEVAVMLERFISLI